MSYNIKLNELKNLLSKLKPGDKVLLQDGIYKDINLNINCKGTLKNRITIKALNPGKVVITGNSSISLEGDYTTFANAIFKDGGKKNSISLKGNGNRLTGCDISFNNSDGPVLMMSMKNNRIDHCIFHDFNKSERWIQKDSGSKSEDYILFDHNIVKNRPKGKDSNGYETIQLRNDDNMIASKTIILNNYFEKCDGELEMISVKSSENIIHQNTIKTVKATVTLRHGRGTIISSNKFLQDNIDESGGIRIIGADHIIYNNLLKDINGGTTTNCALSISNGGNSKPSYQQVKNLKVIKNVLINNECDIALGLSSKGKLVPTDVEFRDNIVYKNNKNPIFSSKGSTCKNVTFKNNKFYGNNFGKNPSNSDPLLKPSEFNITSINEDLYGATEKCGPEWDKQPEDSELKADIKYIYDRLKEKILSEL